jgi:hypothetical protein
MNTRSRRSYGDNQLSQQQRDDILLDGIHKLGALSHQRDTIIQREVLQSCLMWGGLGLTEPPKDEEDWKNAKKIYLMDIELSVLPKNPSCPVLSTLFLKRNYKLRTIPPSFFDDMPALQILNLSRTGIKTLRESILRLVSLKRLFLNDRLSLFHEVVAQSWRTQTARSS